jgi:hypothetical protein
VTKQETVTGDLLAARKGGNATAAVTPSRLTLARNLLARMFQHPVISRLTRALAANREAGIRSRAVAADIWGSGRTGAPERPTASEVTTSIRSPSQNQWGGD